MQNALHTFVRQGWLLSSANDHLFSHQRAWLAGQVGCRPHLAFSSTCCQRSGTAEVTHWRPFQLTPQSLRPQRCPCSRNYWCSPSLHWQCEDTDPRNEWLVLRGSAEVCPASIQVLCGVVSSDTLGSGGDPWRPKGKGPPLKCITVERGLGNTERQVDFTQ